MYLYRYTTIHDMRFVKTFCVANKSDSNKWQQELLSCQLVCSVFYTHHGWYTKVLRSVVALLLLTSCRKSSGIAVTIVVIMQSIGIKRSSFRAGDFTFCHSIEYLQNYEHSNLFLQWKTWSESEGPYNCL